MTTRTTPLPGFESIVGFSTRGFRDQLAFFSSRWENYTSLRELNLFLEETMKKKTSPRIAGKAKADPQFTTFVNYTLPEDEGDNILERFPDEPKIFEAMELLLETGYKIGFSLDSRTGAVICALTCRNEESDNNGKTMTSFADTWMSAMRVAAYKHFFALDQDWSIAESEVKRPKFG